MINHCQGKSPILQLRRRISEIRKAHDIEKKASEGCCPLFRCFILLKIVNLHISAFKKKTFRPKNLRSHQVRLQLRDVGISATHVPGDGHSMGVSFHGVVADLPSGKLT